jgi:hypothetical protein
MTRRPVRRRRFVVEITRGKREPEQLRIKDVDVIAWARGFGAARGESDVLDELRPEESEDVRRIHALQLGEAAGWFAYLYPEEFDPATEEHPA